MDSANTERRVLWTPWMWRALGLICALVGVLSALFCTGLLSSVTRMDDYYYVPYDCQHLECQHAVKQAPDGRSYCAAFPPKDIKMAQVSTGYVRLSQTIVALCGITGLICAGFTALLGMFNTVAGNLPNVPRWLRFIRIPSLAGSLALPLFALCFLWPYGIVPI